jgi:hypothetical protein
MLFDKEDLLTLKDVNAGTWIECAKVANNHLKKVTNEVITCRLRFHHNIYVTLHKEFVLRCSDRYFLAQYHESICNSGAVPSYPITWVIDHPWNNFGDMVDCNEVYAYVVTNTIYAKTPHSTPRPH